LFVGSIAVDRHGGFGGSLGVSGSPLIGWHTDVFSGVPEHFPSVAAISAAALVELGTSPVSVSRFDNALSGSQLSVSSNAVDKVGLALVPGLGVAGVLPLGADADLLLFVVGDCCPNNSPIDKIGQKVMASVTLQRHTWISFAFFIQLPFSECAHLATNRFF
jgi:hypothetical protein